MSKHSLFIILTYNFIIQYIITISISYTTSAVQPVHTNTTIYYYYYFTITFTIRSAYVLLASTAEKCSNSMHSRLKLLLVL